MDISISNIIEDIIVVVIISLITWLIKYLYQSIPTLKRKITTAIFIEAIQGYSEVYIVKSLNYLTLIYPISLYFFIFFTQIYIGGDLKILEEDYKRLVVLQDTNTTKMETKNTITAVNDTNKDIENIDKLKEKISNLIMQYNITQNILTVFVIISILWFNFLLSYRLYYNKERSLFAYQYKRLRDLLFVLISNEDDKVKLFNKEIKVSDKDSLKEYFVMLIECSEKYQIDGVRSRVWLWDD